MSTTNLISKSLGDVLTESGNGVPNHTSPKGSLYVDKDSGRLYQNKDGLTTWFSFSTVAYGNSYYQGNTTQTVISTTNVWTSVANNLTIGPSVGFTVSDNTMVLSEGYDGNYEINAELTISNVVGANNYEVGVSVNGDIPTAGSYNGSSVNSTFITQTIGIETNKTLVGGDTILLGVRNLTTTNNIIIRHAQLFIRRLD